jgi:hypothetical protein
MSGYTFNASALGLGGMLKSGGVTTTVPSLASVALAPTGGEGSAVVENYSKDGVEFTRAESRVVGSQISDDVYSTYADIFITNLTLFAKLKIALMQATVSSTRDVNLPDSEFDVRLMFRGISIGDDEVIPSLDLDLCNALTYGAFATKVRSNLGGYATAFGHPTPQTLDNALGIVTQPVRGTLVKTANSSKFGVIRRQGTAIRVPKFGKVHLGEFQFKPGQRRVTLLRLELDSNEPGFSEYAPVFQSLGGAPEYGDISIASVEGNGSPIGP